MDEATAECVVLIAGFTCRNRLVGRSSILPVAIGRRQEWQLTQPVPGHRKQERCEEQRSSSSLRLEIV